MRKIVWEPRNRTLEQGRSEEGLVEAVVKEGGLLGEEGGLLGEEGGLKGEEGLKQQFSNGGEEELRRFMVQEVDILKDAGAEFLVLVSGFAKGVGEQSSNAAGVVWRALQYATGGIVEDLTRELDTWSLDRDEPSRSVLNGLEWDEPAVISFFGPRGEVWRVVPVLCPVAGEAVPTAALERAIREEDVRGGRVVVMRYGRYQGGEVECVRKVLGRVGACGTFVEPIPVEAPGNDVGLSMQQVVMVVGGMRRVLLLGNLNVPVLILSPILPPILLRIPFHSANTPPLLSVPFSLPYSVQFSPSHSGAAGQSERAAAQRVAVGHGGRVHLPVPVVLLGNLNVQLPNAWLWDMVDEFIYQFQSFCPPSNPPSHTNPPDRLNPVPLRAQVVLLGNLNVQLPNAWLWDMVDEFIYQFQSFCHFRARVKSRTDEENAALKQCGNAWWVGHGARDKFIYQFQSFCHFRARVKSRIDEENAA
ncbi:unnamed protein product [Closterium sp. Naga37s-1]|nr:unnamed protein product [Closterium sp. Naga37s-1]